MLKLLSLNYKKKISTFSLQPENARNQDHSTTALIKYHKITNTWNCNGIQPNNQCKTTYSYVR